MNGTDLRALPLVERKQRLPALVPSESPDLLHVDFVPERGAELFALAFENDQICGLERATSWSPDAKALSLDRINVPGRL